LNYLKEKKNLNYLKLKLKGSFFLMFITLTYLMSKDSTYVITSNEAVKTKF